MIDMDVHSDEFWYTVVPIVCLVLWFIFFDPIRSRLICDSTFCSIKRENILGSKLKETKIKRENIKDIDYKYYHDWLSRSTRSSKYKIIIKTTNGKIYKGSMRGTSHYMREASRRIKQALFAGKDINERI